MRSRLDHTRASGFTSIQSRWQRCASVRQRLHDHAVISDVPSRWLPKVRIQSPKRVPSLALLRFALSS